MSTTNKRDIKKERHYKVGFYFKLLFIISGTASIIWFLIRVIPKPSRALYPCMRTTAPIMSSFIIYLIALSGSVFAFKKHRQLLISKNYLAAISFLLVGIASLFFSQVINPSKTNAALLNSSEIVNNNPIGEAYGIEPGLVVWVNDADATNQNMTNESGDYWWEDKNSDQKVIQSMLDDGIKRLAVKNSIRSAWLALFEYHDEKKGRSKIGYSKGDKIFIKLNLTTSAGNGNKSNHQMDSSPHLLLAILKQLIDEAGVDEADITVGDPFRQFRDLYYDKINPIFPRVVCIDNLGGNGRMQTTLSTERYFTSDGEFNGRIPQAYVDAKYFINMACLKTHDVGGITLCAKNHQGSVMNDQNNDMTIERNLMYPELHYCMPNSNGYKELGNYRHLVDYLGHKYMGGNTVINIIDALISGRRPHGIVEKWHMSPFNNDYTSSLFLSQDRVAIEAVGYDFLYTEYDKFSSKHDGDKHPLLKAVSDYIEQAADPSKHAEDYDPENDGSIINTSMGVYERWNNSTDKQYSQNLSANQVNGIHLVSIPESLVKSERDYEKHPITSIKAVDYQNVKSYSLICAPNLVTDFVQINYTLEVGAQVIIEVFNISGIKVAVVTNELVSAGKHAVEWVIPDLAAGTYIVQLSIKESNNSSKQSIKLKINK